MISSSYYIEGNKKTGNYVICDENTHDKGENVFIVKRFGEKDAAYIRVNFPPDGQGLLKRECALEEKAVCKDALTNFKKRSELEKVSEEHYKYYPYERCKGHQDEVIDLETGELLFEVKKPVYWEVKGLDTEEEKFTGHSYDLEEGGYKEVSLSALTIIFFKAAIGCEDMIGHLKKVEG